MSKNEKEKEKEIRYPKPGKSKDRYENKNKENINNIKIYPKDDIEDIIINNDKINKKKDKSKNKIIKNKKKESKPKKYKLNLLLKKINKISITNEDNNYNEYNNEIKYNENPLEEYEDDIMNYLYSEEIKNRPIYSLFPSSQDINNNNIILSYMKRFSFINLFISFQRELILKQETLYLCINLFDRYIQKLNSDNMQFQDMNKIAITCLFIA